jgi:hypothetical protein
VTLGSEPVMRSRILSNGISAAFRIAVLAGFDQLLGLAQSCGVDEHNDLLFRRGVEEVASHGADSITAAELGSVNEDTEAAFSVTRWVCRAENEPCPSPALCAILRENSQGG